MYLTYQRDQIIKNTWEETVLLWHQGKRELIMSILSFDSMKTALTVNDQHCLKYLGVHFECNKCEQLYVNSNSRDNRSLELMLLCLDLPTNIVCNCF